MRRIAAALIACLMLAGLIAPAVVVAKSDNAAQTTPYTFEWPPEDPNFFCTGTRIVKIAPDGFIKDSEECWSSNPGEPGTQIFDPYWTDEWGADRRWFSDYDGRAATWAEVITYADGTSRVTAYYDYAYAYGSFGGHDYRVFGQAVTWHQAKDFCQGDGGHLATISSGAENEFVWLLRPYWFDQTWLGATDEAVEGTWVWVTGEPFTYTNWGSGEPNNSPPIPDSVLGEDFLTFHGPGAYSPPTPGVWNDWQYEADGSASLLPFVCEYE